MATAADDVVRDLVAAIERGRWDDLARFVSVQAGVADHRVGTADAAPRATAVRDEAREWCDGGPFELDVAVLRGGDGPVAVVDIMAIVAAGYAVTTLAVIALRDGCIVEGHLFDSHELDAAHEVYERLLGIHAPDPG